MDPDPLPVAAVLLAGGDARDALAASAGVAAKALVPMRDRPLGAWVLEALAESRAVGEVIYVGPTVGRLAGLYHRALPSGRRLVDSLALGLGAALAPAAGPAPERLLVLTADVPWVTGPMLDRLLADAPRAALVVPAIREVDALAQFPGQRRTYARIGGERLTAGNALLLDAAAVPAVLPFVDRVYRARKNPLALAALVGAGVATSLATGRLDLAALERRVGRLLGLEARVHLSRDAALGADVDRLEHLASGPALPERLAGGVR